MEERIFNLHKFLEDLPKKEYTSETEFLSTEVPIFISILGYQKFQLFFEVGLPVAEGKHFQRRRADALVTSERAGHPWLLIETKRIQRTASELVDWKARLQQYKTSFEAEYAVLLSPFLIVVAHDGLEFECRLDKISIEEASEIYSSLRSPTHIPEQAPEEIETPRNLEIKEETFRLQLRQYAHQLDFVMAAETNDEKKRSFEGLAKLLFDGIPFLTCRDANLRTSSSEIDIVVEYQGWTKPTLFDEFGRFCLVECKNWKSAVGVQQIRDFKGKLDKTKLKLGILFARNGITGADDGADGLREIRSTFDREGTYILVVAAEDLTAIERGANFYELLDEKMFGLRFGL